MKFNPCVKFSMAVPPHQTEELLNKIRDLVDEAQDLDDREFKLGGAYPKINIIKSEAEVERYRVLGPLHDALAKRVQSLMSIQPPRDPKITIVATWYKFQVAVVEGTESPATVVQVLPNASVDVNEEALAKIGWSKPQLEQAAAAEEQQRRGQQRR